MSTDVTINLPDSVCQTAEVWARESGRSLSEFLADAIEASLLPLGISPAQVGNWSDEELLTAADDFLSPEEDRRLSELLAMQRESELDAAGRGDLAHLMHAYQERLIRKAAAIREAVQRGLREPLAS